MAARDAEPGTADQARRSLIRGIALVGLAGAAGLPLAGCGKDDVTASGAPPAGEGGAVTGTAQAPRAATTKKPASKSDVYKRTPEPRPARTTPPKIAEPGPSPLEVDAEPTAGSKGGDVATVRKKDGTGKKTAEPTATPEPLPPGALARTSDIPVGGGKAFEAEKIIVTQPTKGTFKGFSATCTHTGCLIDKVAEGAIICPCHGSRFSIADGTVQKGPALLPLPAEPIAVDDRGTITRG